MAKFQEFVDEKMQGWKVVGVKSVDPDIGSLEEGDYRLLLKKDTATVVIHVTAANFEEANGQQSIHIYPSIGTRKRPAEEDPGPDPDDGPW